MEPIPTINTTGIKIYIINLIKNKKKSNFYHTITYYKYIILYFVFQFIYKKENKKKKQKNAAT